MGFALEIEPVTYRLRTPFATAFGTLETRDLLCVTLTAPDGVRGRGEAAPLEPYDDVSLAAVEAALLRYREALAALDADADGARALAACRAAADLPQALAAIDLALWDAAGQRAGRPVAALLAGERAHAAQVAVNGTIGACDPARAGELARGLGARGLRTVKVKVGTGDPDADRARVEAVATVGGTAIDAIRIDANGAWTVDEAAALLGPLAQATQGRLELCEEPVSGIARFRSLRARLAPGAYRLAGDETVVETGMLTAAVADAVCLKIGRAGGIGALCAQAVLARSSGTDVYLASTFDGPLGIAAALHCAAALTVHRPCGLATLEAFHDVDPAVLPVDGGAIALPTAPGLGAP